MLLAWLLFLKDCDLFELTSLNSVFWSGFLYLPRSLYCPFAQNIPCVVFWSLLSQLLLEGDPLPHKSLPTLYKCEKAAYFVTHWSRGHAVFIEDLFSVSELCYWSCFPVPALGTGAAVGLLSQWFRAHPGLGLWSRRHLMVFPCLGESLVFVLNLTVKHRVKLDN